MNDINLEAFIIEPVNEELVVAKIAKMIKKAWEWVVEMFDKAKKKVLDKLKEFFISKPFGKLKKKLNKAVYGDENGKKKPESTTESVSYDVPIDVFNESSEFISAFKSAVEEGSVSITDIKSIVEPVKGTIDESFFENAATFKSLGDQFNKAYMLKTPELLQREIDSFCKDFGHLIRASLPVTLDTKLSHAAFKRLDYNDVKDHPSFKYIYNQYINAASSVEEGDYTVSLEKDPTYKALISIKLVNTAVSVSAQATAETATDMAQLASKWANFITTSFKNVGDLYISCCADFIAIIQFMESCANKARGAVSESVEYDFLAALKNI